jgi:hypothetical protein
VNFCPATGNNRVNSVRYQLTFYFLACKRFLGREFVGLGKIILQVPPLKKRWETLL